MPVSDVLGSCLLIKTNAFAGVEERGRGSFARMKNHMVSDVDYVRYTMFRSANIVVRGRLAEMCQHVKDQMLAQTQELHARLVRDYLAVLAGADASAFKEISRAERMLRSEMAPLLAQADQYFAVVATRERQSPGNAPSYDINVEKEAANPSPSSPGPEELSIKAEPI